MKERFETFTVLINRVKRNIRKIMNQEMREFDLRSAHISCLYYLYTVDNITATDLCERCEEDKATISRSIDYLETNGYLTCESTKAQRYRCPYVLTKKGIEVGKKIADKVDGILNELNDGLNEEERVAFYRSFSYISAKLEAIANKFGT